MEEKNTQSDRAAVMASRVKKTMGNVGGLAYELNRAEYGINSAITRCRALNLNDVEAELVALARNLNRITASLQPAIFVELGVLNDPVA
jgi:hypothetical protein